MFCKRFSVFNRKIYCYDFITISVTSGARFFLLLCMLLSAAQAETLSFETLDENEKISIEFESQGCFHNKSHSFNIAGGQNKSVEVFQEDSNGLLLSLGTAKLSSYDLKGLDILLSIYRNDSENFCTTHNLIDVVYKRDNIEIGTESFVDNACLVSTIQNIKSYPKLADVYGEMANWSEIKNVVSLDSLTERVSK